MKIIIAVLCIGLIHGSVAQSGILSSVMDSISSVYNSYRSGEYLKTINTYVRKAINGLELLKIYLSLPALPSLSSLSSLPSLSTLSSLTSTVSSLASVVSSSLPSGQSIPLLGAASNALQGSASSGQSSGQSSQRPSQQSPSLMRLGGRRSWPGNQG